MRAVQRKDVFPIQAFGRTAKRRGRAQSGSLDTLEAQLNAGPSVQKMADLSKQANANGPVMQRMLADFEADTLSYKAPSRQIADHLVKNADSFAEKPDAIRNKIRARTGSIAQTGTIAVPKTVEAEFLKESSTGKTAERSGNNSSTVGGYGRDEFLIKKDHPDYFEGGHIIPHALVKEDNPLVKKIDGFENLVPMSRQVNMKDWAVVEEQMKSKLASVNEKDILLYTVNVAHSGFNLSLSDLAKTFGLTQTTEFTDKTLAFDGWLPTGMTSKYEHYPAEVFTNSDFDLVSEDEFSPVEESTYRQFETISDEKGFQSILDKTGISRSLDGTMKNKRKRAVLEEDEGFVKKRKNKLFGQAMEAHVSQMVKLSKYLKALHNIDITNTDLTKFLQDNDILKTPFEADIDTEEGLNAYLIKMAGLNWDNIATALKA